MLLSGTAARRSDRIGCLDCRPHGLHTTNHEHCVPRICIALGCSTRFGFLACLLLEPILRVWVHATAQSGWPCKSLRNELAEHNRVSFFACIVMKTMVRIMYYTDSLNTNICCGCPPSREFSCLWLGKEMMLKRSPGSQHWYSHSTDHCRAAVTALHRTPRNTIDQNFDLLSQH